MTNPDTFFHLRLGGEFLDGWNPRNPGSVTEFATAEWLPTQWLGQLALASSERAFGLGGVAALTGVAVAAMITIIFLAARWVGSSAAAAAMVPLVILGTLSGLSGRPQVVSYALVAVVTAGWIAASRHGRTPWWIVPLTWAWSMTHGMWSASVVISVTAIIGLSLDRQLPAAGAWRFLAVPMLSLAAAAVTPMGLGLYSASQRVSEISGYFHEWGPTEFASVGTLATGLMVAAAIALLGRQRARAPWTLLLLVLLAGVWTVYSMRTVPLAACMLAPLVSALASGPASPTPRHRRESAMIAITVTGLTVVALGTASTSATDPRGTSPAHLSVANLPSGTRLLTSWTDGGYDMWRHPDLQITSHGYGDMFTDAELARNDALRSARPDWRRHVQSLGVDHALLRADEDLATLLVREANWVVVAQDPAPSSQNRRGGPARIHLRAPGASS